MPEVNFLNNQEAGPGGRGGESELNISEGLVHFISDQRCARRAYSAARFASIGGPDLSFERGERNAEGLCRPRLIA